MTTINLTLLVQMVHFLIAYFLIEKLLLVPFMNLLRQKKQEEELLNHLLVEGHEQLEYAERQKSEQRKKALESFLLLVPQKEEMEAGTAGKAYEIHQTPALRSDQEAELIKPIVSVLVEKIKNM